MYTLKGIAIELPLWQRIAIELAICLYPRLLIRASRAPDAKPPPSRDRHPCNAHGAQADPARPGAAGPCGHRRQALVSQSVPWAWEMALALELAFPVDPLRWLSEAQIWSEGDIRHCNRSHEHPQSHFYLDTRWCRRPQSSPQRDSPDTEIHGYASRVALVLHSLRLRSLPCKPSQEDGCLAWLCHCPHAP